MLGLAVATDAETLARIREPLAGRGIEAEHVRTSERTIDLRGTGGSAGGSTGGFADFDADAGFVFPPRLAEGGVADALLDVPWVNDREAVLRSRHKAEALARLSRAGIPTPATVMVSNPADEDALCGAFERFDPPVVVKPNSATRGTGVAKAGDLDSFLGVVDYLDLVHDYRATGDRGEYVGAVERRLPEDALAAGRWKHNVHRGAEAAGVDLPPALRDLAERAAAALDVRWLGVDLLVPGGDPSRAVVNETNARPTVDARTKYEDGFYDRLATLIRETAASTDRRDRRD